MDPVQPTTPGGVPPTEPTMPVQTPGQQMPGAVVPPAVEPEPVATPDPVQTPNPVVPPVDGGNGAPQV